MQTKLQSALVEAISTLLRTRPDVAPVIGVCGVTVGQENRRSVLIVVPWAERVATGEAFKDYRLPVANCLQATPQHLKDELIAWAVREVEAGNIRHVLPTQKRR